MTCAACGLAKEVDGTTTTWGAPVDPWFGAPLWLTADVAGHLVWAYNARHLTVLRAFIAADLRERTPTQGAPRSMVEELPSWLKDAKHRPEVLRALDRLLTRAQ